MAFDQTRFGPIGGQSKRGKAPQVFSYFTSDAIATVKGSGYFDSIADLLSADDMIMCAANDEMHIIRIAAITSGVVTSESNDISEA